MGTCAHCGAAIRAPHRFCGQCGARLDAGAAGDEVRRRATVVTSDLKGSTALGERLDPETLREALTLYFDEMRAVFEFHGGTIEKIIGDAILAVFGLPIRHDDDALRAVEAAFESRGALAALNETLDKRWGVRLQVRTGVSTGDVLFGEASLGEHVLTGDTIKVASAMEQNAPQGEVLIAEPTYEAVRELVEVEPVGPVVPKGMDERFPAYRLVSVAARIEPGRAVDEGAAPGRSCPACGDSNPDGFTYCGTCGSSLAVVPRAGDTRKTVTLVFADPRPATLDGRPPSPEALREVMSRYFAEVKVALERHGGTVEKFIGDAVMAVFGLPVRHEDDAVRAIRAAAEMQAALPALNESLRTGWGMELGQHVGVNTGTVVAGDASLGQRLVTGDAVNTAARLEQAAGAGEVILGELTRRLAGEQVEVEPILPLSLKGKAEPVPAYRLVKVAPRPVERKGVDTPFVGRQEERELLAASLADARHVGACRLVTIIGDAGVGKTRLLREFSRAVEGTSQVVRGRCLAYGDGVTYWPILEIVRAAARIAEDDPADVAMSKITELADDPDDEADDPVAIASRVASAIGLSAVPFRGPELFWGIRRMLEAMARRRPLAVVIDDIHVASPTFLDLLDHLLEASSHAPILLVAVGRRELLDDHPEWAAAHPGGRIVLEPLTGDDADTLLDQLLPGLEAPVRRRILDAAEGNPLYVEQIASMLVERGSVRLEGVRWVAADADRAIAVPPSVEALVAARLDALSPAERQVIDPASVIGLGFAHEALEELLEPAARPTLGERLDLLSSKQLVRAVTADEFYRFGHAVIRDTAYGSLLKRVRAAWHEAFVAWAEPVNRARGREIEFEEILGYHLEQAYRYRVELGALDARAREVGIRAAEMLASAGRRAISRGDRPGAASLLRRAIAMMASESEGRAAVLPDLAIALTDLGAFEEARAALTEAIATARRLGSIALAARSEIGLIALEVYSGEAPRGSEQAARDLQAAIADLERAGDDAGLARAWLAKSLLAGTTGQFAEAADAALRAVPYARRAGDVRRVAQAAQTYAGMALVGPTRVAEVIEHSEQLLLDAAEDRMAESVILGSVAVLDAMQGSFDEARTRSRRSREMLEEMGPTVMAMATSTESARVELLAGDPARAEEELRRDYEALEALGERYYRSTIAALLAEALYLQGRSTDALEFSRVAEELADPDDTAVQIWWRSARAKLLAAEGRADEALALVDAAITLARESGSPSFIGGVLADQATVLELSGRGEAAGPPLREALAVFERKGDLVSAGRVRARLAGAIGAG
jgi:class 3 adenylate cyclase/tetratricopeptide (TPR) repeat protein